MTYFPKDAYMLLSFVNMKLRDEYSSLSTLCEDTEEDEKQIKELLYSIGYIYDEKQNAFIVK